MRPLQRRSSSVHVRMSKAAVVVYSTTTRAAVPRQRLQQNELQLQHELHSHSLRRVPPHTGTTCQAVKPALSLRLCLFRLMGTSVNFNDSRSIRGERSSSSSSSSNDVAIESGQRPSQEDENRSSIDGISAGLDQDCSDRSTDLSNADAAVGPQELPVWVEDVRSGSALSLLLRHHALARSIEVAKAVAAREEAFVRGGNNSDTPGRASVIVPDSAVRVLTAVEALAEAADSARAASDVAHELRVLTSSKLDAVSGRRVEAIEFEQLADEAELEATHAQNQLAPLEQVLLAALAADEIVCASGELTEGASPEELDSRPAIVEVRGAAGGDEAGLFAMELFEMLERFSLRQGWKVEVLQRDMSGPGSLRCGVARVGGENVYASLKHECGIHRVQRIPATESGGRVHTSTAAVVVLPEAEAVDVNIDPKDIRVDTFRSSGAGGQHVNCTDSAVRITHIPSNLVVAVQDERSQHKNKEKALSILRSRLFDLQRAELARERKGLRQAQIGSGDRSERIRTYNFSQGRVTDHRSGQSVHDLDAMMAGGSPLEELHNGLRSTASAQAIEALERRLEMQRLEKMQKRSQRT